MNSSTQARTKTPPIILSFAGSDPSGGAGIQADLLTQSALGCYALSVITTLTIQDSVGVYDTLAVRADWVARQARTLLAEMPVAVFKIGLLGSLDNLRVIARILEEHPKLPVVFDPVLASGRGDALIEQEMIAELRKLLLPQTTVLTPNSLEARRLSGLTAHQPLADCAQHLIADGCQQVLITGAHEDQASPEVRNHLYDQHGLVRCDRWPRLTGSYHGSGCTLASALAAYLAWGYALPEAAAQAQAYTWQTLANAYQPGQGQWIPQRLYALDPHNAPQEKSQAAPRPNRALSLCENEGLHNV
ncbi:MAG: hydroxymethylpyrimidine/phosphomethylpyrimidine kinase [Pseudomonadota bacterium]